MASPRHDNILLVRDKSGKPEATCESSSVSLFSPELKVLLADFKPVSDAVFTADDYSKL